MEPFLDPINSESPLTGEKSDPSFFIQLPKNIASYSLTSQTILEELRVRHRRLEMHGSAEITPSLLLTVDSIPELLSKQVQLTESHKSQSSIVEALKELAGLTEHNKEPVVYFYPFLLQVDQKLTMRISMIAPQNKEKTDIIPYRRACFKYSIDLVDLLFKNRAGREFILDEVQPGSTLVRTDQKGNTYFFPTKLSYETELELMIRKTMESFGYIPMKDFIQDVITRGKETAKLVEIIPGYHLILPNGSHNPEYARHLAVQLDGLRTFSFPYLKRFANENKYVGYLEKLNELEMGFPTQTEELLKQGSNLVPKLTSLLEEFPFDKIASEEGKRVASSIRESLIILDKLSKRLKEQKKENAEESITALIKLLGTKIEDNTINTLTLTKIDLNSEVKTLGLRNETDVAEAISKIVSSLSETYGCLEMKEETFHILFALDQKKLSKVEANTLMLAKTDSHYRNELPILDQIRVILKNRSDENIDKEENLEKDYEEENDSNQISSNTQAFSFSTLQEKFHVPIGVFSFLTLASLITVISLFIGSLEYIVSGFLFSFLVGLLFGYLYRNDGKKKHLQEKQIPNVSFKENRSQGIAKIAEGFIYPKKFNSIAEKVYDFKRLRNHIEDCVEDIKIQLPAVDQKKDNNKIVAEIEHAIIQISVVMKIPEAIQLKNRPKELILSKADFRTILFRTQLAEYYRKEASIYKSDRDQMDYIQFIIRELEFGYNKYLK
ncbi:hypothetical protein ND861_14135 [Leptospira sp. 2 VSF19]|uniref:Uncharacterized protein n=1 Tax=Leptospira soteropolitanensis TaxID=2950025 RepID=A0AAW5VIF9_9LEPT|nr:hypothetical protein [Leptospira soteropolitanensis]MCW7493783.1 hypothetical protein [Leptospira soteropolitanensis]MCW7501381.1 hypothetical protein [Leptospira soteropolitanensis]MCW7523433.1 hypothetical protein [Leptospira soteropolitanensis]MCW7527495.1 hypothetical protein [Leptospira soteropolitanensis]MCW7531351.1 hypothetical protein [Leptospira soteropolitanensis]